MTYQYISAHQMSKLMFYVGATLVLSFIMWATIAPYASGADPSWWEPEMARAGMIGLAAMVGGISFMAFIMAYDSIQHLLAEFHGGDDA